MIGTATGALAQLGLNDDVMRQQQANIAAGYAVTYILGYILTLLFVPFAAPWLMGIDLKEEAAKLEALLSGGKATPKSGNFGYQKFKARAYRVVTAAGQTVGTVEDRIGQRVVVERIVRNGNDVDSGRRTVLEAGDEIVLAGPATTLVRAGASIGPEIEGAEVLREVQGDALGVLVGDRALHGRTLAEIADRVGEDARGVFVRDLTRRGQEVPLTPETRIYLGDIMTLVGATHDVERAAAKVGQVLRYGDRTDIAFLAAGIAAGLLGLLSVKVGSLAITLGGAGGTLLVGLICGWLRARRPTVGSFPPAAQQTLGDIGLGGFIAAIGLANGPAAIAAIQSHGLLLLSLGMVVTLVPLTIATIAAHRILHLNPVIICGALAGAMTVDAAVTGCCERADSQTPVLGVAVPYAVGNVLLTILGPVIVTLTYAG
jgi:AspT/YidE/YbjL antiporter-like protein